MKQGSQQDYLSNKDMSAAITGTWIPLERLFGYCIDSQWTGAGAKGTIKLQATNDPNNASIAAKDVANSSVAVSGAGGQMWNVTDVFYPYVRLVFTPDGGGSVGNLWANLWTKG